MDTRPKKETHTHTHTHIIRGEKRKAPVRPKYNALGWKNRLKRQRQQVTTADRAASQASAQTGYAAGAARPSEGESSKHITNCETCGAEETIQIYAYNAGPAEKQERMKEGAQRESVSKKSNKKILRAEKELKIECQRGHYEARRSGAKKTPKEPARA